MRDRHGTSKARQLRAGRAAQRVLVAARAGMIRFLRRTTNGTTTASARTTAPRRRIPSYMEFALRIRETRTFAVKRSHRARHTHARPPDPRVGTRGPGTVLAALGPRRTARWIRGGRKNVQASTLSNFSDQHVPASRAGAGGLRKAPRRHPSRSRARVTRYSLGVSSPVYPRPCHQAASG
jgi:hypothetical protein